MPVKITTSTNSQTGKITSDDLSAMKYEFENNVTLSRSGGLPIIKKLAWYVTKAELDALFSLNKNGDEMPTVLEINFAVHLDQPNLCDQESLADGLTVVLQAKNNEHDKLETPDEYVVIPGYNTFTGQAITLRNLNGDNCCPSSKPKPPVGK